VSARAEAAPASEAPREATTASRIALDRWFLTAGFALALLPVLAIVVTRIGSDYFPIGDDASIALRVRDVFTSSIPLVGPFSHGFAHPGPLAFWLLAPLSELVGGAPWSILVGGALLHGVAIGASGWLAYRRGGLLLALLVLAGLGLAYTGLPPGNPFLGAWNPNLAYPFFMLFLLQVWSFADGRRWQLLGASLTATVLVQLHVSYVPLVVAAGAWAVIVVVVASRRGTAQPEHQPPYVTVIAASVGASALLWLAPVVQQLTHEPGNFGLMVEYFTERGRAHAGLATGAGLFAAQFSWVPPWLGGNGRYVFVLAEPASTRWLLVPLALLAVGFYAAHRSGRVADRRLVELAAVTSVASIVAMSRVDLELFFHLFLWRTLAAVFLVVAVAWAVLNAVEVERRSAARLGAVVGLLALIAWAFWPIAHTILDVDGDITPRETQSRAIVESILADGVDHPVQIRGYAATNGFTQALVDGLDRGGATVRVPRGYGDQYGDRRTASAHDVDEIWFATADGRAGRRLLGEPHARLVAYDSVLPPRVDAEMDALQDQVGSELHAAGRDDLSRWLEHPFLGLVLTREDVPGVDTKAVRRLSELNDRLARTDGCRCTVVAFPSGAAPDVPYTLGF
jgi:hypothetical protein